MTRSNLIQTICVSSEDFNSLKCDFREAINSQRRLERIESISDLIDVLWKRDEIGSHNIEALFCNSFSIFSDDEKAIIRNYISEFNNDLYPLSQVTEASTSAGASPVYGHESGPELSRMSGNYLSQYHKQFYDNKEEIFRLISQEMGLRKFMDFARQKSLQIAESELENLSDSHRDVPSRIYEVLKNASQRNSSDAFPDIILAALAKSGRVDLKTKIQKRFLS